MGCGGADYGFGEAVHFFGLGAELQQEQVHAGALEFADAVGHLLRRADQARTQAAIRDGIFFVRYALLQLRVG